MTVFADSIPLVAEATAFQHLTRYFSGLCCDAAAYCLEANGHRSPTQMSIRGACNETVMLRWDSPPAQTASAYPDGAAAAAVGACAIALATLHHTHGYQTLERSARCTGLDFWVSDAQHDIVFAHATPLEVLGLFRGEGHDASKQRDDWLRRARRRHGEHRRITLIAEFGGPSILIDAGAQS